MAATPRTDEQGLVKVPVAAGATAASLASTCDPALTGLLADFATILKTKLNAAWHAAAGSAMAADVVTDTFPHEPTQAVINRTWRGPALFMWRTKEREFLRTLAYTDAECTVKLLYVLPPMPEELMLKLDPIRVAVRVCLVQFVEQFGDPTLHPTGDLLSVYGLESFTFTEANYGYFPGVMSSLDLPFPALDMTALMRERQTWVTTQFNGLTQFETIAELSDDTLGDIDLVEIKTTLTPT